MKGYKIGVLIFMVLVLVGAGLGCTKAPPQPPPPGMQYSISPDAELVSVKWYLSGEGPTDKWLAFDVEVKNKTKDVKKFDVGVKAGDSGFFYDQREVKAGATVKFSVQSGSSAMTPDSLKIEIK